MKISTRPRQNEEKRENFAVMLTELRSISKKDIERIGRRSGLAPVFFCVSEKKAIEAARFYARALNAPIMKVHSFGEISSALRYCAFSICDDRRSAVFSVCSGVPAFVSAKNEKCRMLLGRMAAAGCPRGIMTPYTKNTLENIKEVGARGSDFGNVIHSVMERIKTHRQT